MNDQISYFDLKVKPDLQLAVAALLDARPVDQPSFIADWLDRRARTMQAMADYLEEYQEAKKVQMEIMRFNDYDTARCRKLAAEERVKRQTREISEAREQLLSTISSEEGFNRVEELAKRLTLIVEGVTGSRVLECESGSGESVKCVFSTEGDKVGTEVDESERVDALSFLEADAATRYSQCAKKLLLRLHASQILVLDCAQELDSQVVDSVRAFCN